MEPHDDDYVVFVTDDDTSKRLLEKLDDRVGVYNKFGIRILCKKVSEDDLPDDIDSAPTACVRGRNIVGNSKIIGLFDKMVKARMPKRSAHAAPDPDDVIGYMNRMVGVGKGVDSLDDINTRDTEVGDDGDTDDLSKKMNAELVRRKNRHGGGKREVPTNVETEAADNVGDDDDDGDDMRAQMNIDKNGGDGDYASDEMDAMLKQLIDAR